MTFQVNCMPSFEETISMKSQSLISGKNMSKCNLLIFFSSMLSVNFLVYIPRKILAYLTTHRKLIFPVPLSIEGRAPEKMLKKN